jgi:hypothetical protein
MRNRAFVFREGSFQLSSIPGDPRLLKKSRTGMQSSKIKSEHMIKYSPVEGRKDDLLLRAIMINLVIFRSSWYEQSALTSRFMNCIISYQDIKPDAIVYDATFWGLQCERFGRDMWYELGADRLRYPHVIFVCQFLLPMGKYSQNYLFMKIGDTRDNIDTNIIHSRTFVVTVAARGIPKSVWPNTALSNFRWFPAACAIAVVHWLFLTAKQNSN